MSETSLPVSKSLPALQQALDRYLKEEIEAGSFPGAVYLAGTSREILAESALGHSVLRPAKIRTDLETIYDVASLTKPLITATLYLLAFEEGIVAPGDRVSRFVPELAQTDKSELTFLDLLTHRGGFQAWYPLYTQGIGDDSYLAAIVRRPLRYRPGTREIYSCLGFILLQLALQRAYGKSAEDLSIEKIFRPLGLTRSMFSPESHLKYQIAATEWGNANERQMVSHRNLTFPGFRTYMIWGEVNDGNAYHMGGMAGNAGLFATARDVYAIARTYVSNTLLSEDSIEHALRNYTMGLEENRGIGWQLQNQRPDHPSAVLSENCFGHTGFTGTSVWVDRDRDLIMVLLTNRLHPTVRPLNMQKVRRRFHEIVVKAWE